MEILYEYEKRKSGQTEKNPHLSHDILIKNLKSEGVQLYTYTCNLSE